MSDTSFVEEIQDMIWAFGDVSRGQLATAELMEKVLHQQLLWLWSAVVNTAENQGSVIPTIENFIFLLRKNTSHWDRLIRYLSRKKFINSSRSPFLADPTKVTISALCKRSIAYMKTLDPLWEYDEEAFDEKDYRKLLRSDETTRYQDPVRYQEFTAARRVSFGHGGPCEKFSMFLNRIDIDHLRNPETTDLMAFFAYEMIGEIVDLVLISRPPGENRAITPADVREVIRRLFSVQTLPGALFLRLPSDGRNTPILFF